MTGDLARILGGVGLFLLGMTLLTQGLRALAGDALRRVLARFTHSPATGAATGAFTTAVIQSSSATIVATVGFVGAGLLTFPQAIGVIFGANIGTTLTGWLVALIGFKLSLGTALQPFILVGVLMHLFGNGRTRHMGLALAGFSLLFVGIEALKGGMEPFQGIVTPEHFPPDTLWGRLQLVFLGIAITLVTQSSSAGVVTALAAVGVGTISFSQAAAMVIGMDVGTTFTAALATVGGSVATRRTGFAHVIYNLITGLAAFFFLDLYTMAVDWWVSGGADGNAQLALVGFHTAFNTLGVAAALPFAAAFARFIERMVPERGPALVKRLDDRLLRDPGAAVDAAVATMRDLSVASFEILTAVLRPGAQPRPDATQAAALESAIEAAHRFTDRIHADPSHEQTHDRLVASLHLLDHLSRLARRLRQQVRIAALHEEPRLARRAALLAVALSGAASGMEEGDAARLEISLDRRRSFLRRRRHPLRQILLSNAAITEEADAEIAIRRLDALRWLLRVADHAWRIAHHLARAEAAEARGSRSVVRANTLTGRASSVRDARCGRRESPR